MPDSIREMVHELSVVADRSQLLLESVAQKYKVASPEEFTCPHHRALYAALDKLNQLPPKLWQGDAT